MRTFTLLLVTLGLAACGVEPDLASEPAVEDGLVIASADANHITGTYGENDRGLEFSLHLFSDSYFATVGVRGQSVIDSAFERTSASSTILDRLTFVRTDAGLETIGDTAALEDFAAIPESELLPALRAALRTHGIVDEIVTIP